MPSASGQKRSVWIQSGNSRTCAIALFVYVWFVVSGKLIWWWWNPAFLSYDGPSLYLALCVHVGRFALFAVAMAPFAYFILGPKAVQSASHHPSPEKPLWFAFMHMTGVACVSVLLVVYGFIASFVFMVIGAIIESVVSYEAAEIFMHVTTIAR